MTAVELVQSCLSCLEIVVCDQRRLIFQADYMGLCCALKHVIYLVYSRVFANKDEEDEASSEKIDTANDPQANVSSCETCHVHMISMNKAMNTLKYPQNSHYNEQFAVEYLII